MTKVSLDHTRMLGFRLLSTDDTSGDTVVMGGKSGKTMVGGTAQDILSDAMATSAKFGKEGKVNNIEGAMALSGKFGKVGKVRPQR